MITDPPGISTNPAKIGATPIATGLPLCYENSMKKIRYYITGHGLGHASRSCHLINTLRARHPQISVEVVSDAKEWFLRTFLDPSVNLERRGLDFGVLQRDSLLMREEETLQALRAHLQRRETIVAAEAASLNKSGVDLVVADIPPFAFAAAERASIPSVGVSNFTWEWIYEGFAEKFQGYDDVVEGVRSDYRCGDLLLRLPFHKGEPALKKVEDLPLLARRPLHDSGEVRRQLAIPDRCKVALLSFGGFGLEEFDFAPLGRLSDWIFLADPEMAGGAPNVRSVSPGAFHYPDLVKVADAVITKPGYGIVSECIALQTAVLYTPRGDFREQVLLVEALHRYTRALPVENEQVRRGDLGEALETLLAQPAPADRLGLDGDIAGADRLSQLLG
jgi:hypothetical protein